jgi:large subunit ribosomal protein L21
MVLFRHLGVAIPNVRSYIANHDRKKPVRARLSVYRVTNTRNKKMFAVIKTGGKQYRVVAEDILRVDRVEAEPGSVIEFGEVLVVGGDSTTLGAPTVAGATVAAEVLDHVRGPKVIAFKKRRRKNSRRKRGHRQEFSLVRITEILTEGKKPSQTPPPRPKREPRPEKPEASEAVA